MTQMILLRDSKIYTYLMTKAGENPHLTSLVPDIRAQLLVEKIIDESYPRDDSLGEATRILINYTALNNKTQLYQFIDEERLDRSFPIDHFLNGYHTSLHADCENLEEEGLLEKTILTALNTSLLSILGLDAEMSTKKLKALSETVVKSLVCLLTNDAKDVMILVNELALKEGQRETESQLRSLWTLKYRDTPIEAFVE